MHLSSRYIIPCRAYHSCKKKKQTSKTEQTETKYKDDREDMRLPTLNRRSKFTEDQNFL